MELKMNRCLSHTKAHLALLVLISADAVALLSSIVISLMLRFDSSPWPQVYQQYLRPHLYSLPLVLTIYLTAFSKWRLYRCAWRFASLEMLWAVIFANTAGIVGLVAVQTAFDGDTFPRAVVIMLWTTGIVLTGGTRVVLRTLSIARQYGKRSVQVMRKDAHRRRVLIIGAGANGVRILRAVREDPALLYSVIGFLDDDPAKKGVYIDNVQVLGPVDTLNQLLDDNAVDEVIVALPQIGEHRLREYVMECRARKLPVKIVPRISDVLSGRSPMQLVDFDVEDLLRREPASTDVRQVGAYVTGKRVLVTGAGGSIGSELCRQIISLDPASLVLLGHGENSIHTILTELRYKYPHMVDRIHYAVASVAHKPRVEQVMRIYKPQVVFHAAAHKHVPMMETNEQEAVRNNVLGTHNVAEACGRFDVERIVLISTDKAADPCCVMGTTKRLCEDVLRCAAIQWPKTCYVTVRFGNVLGSRGSVVAIFREQIQRGASVTVTHPEMTRYFMTIPEAVRLVLQAGAVGTSGNLYLLEMGQPVRVLDLARDMIKLSGFEPDVDIKIEFTGMRPGEKLHERLTSDDEWIEKTHSDGLSLIRRPEILSSDSILDTLERLQHVANYGTPSETRGLLAELVPGCRAPEEILEAQPKPVTSRHEAHETENVQAI
jgi:FlaA1/EpsC-like NDP-sugar epimerase